MGKKSVGLLVLTLLVVAALAGLKFYKPRSLDTKEEVQAQKALPPEIVKLNSIQEEIGKLSDEEILKQINDLKTELKAGDLVGRVNKGMVEGKEKERAKDMLVRLSLLGVEKSKRAQKAPLEAEK